MIFGQGTLHPGPRHDYGLWEKPLGEPMGVTFGDRFVQIGNFRLGDVDSKHFSVSHVTWYRFHGGHRGHWGNMDPGNL